MNVDIAGIKPVFVCIKSLKNEAKDKKLYI